MTYSTLHQTFVIERDIAAPPSLAFFAWSDAAAKDAWFRGPAEWQALERHFDFREGGAERVKGRHASGMTSDFQCRYSDIVPDSRIVYSYDMYVDDKRISVSLATIEFTAIATGTHLKLTEQMVHFDGYPTPEDREKGTYWLVEKAAAYIEGELVKA